MDSGGDSPSGGGNGGGVLLELTDNYNKILVLDAAANQLIACGTVKQGLCAKYPAADISAGPTEVLGEAVAANRPDATTFGFVGPSQYSRWSGSDVLYVGTTFTNHGDYRQDSLYSGHDFHCFSHPDPPSPLLPPPLCVSPSLSNKDKNGPNSQCGHKSINSKPKSRKCHIHLA
jgi:hypothetical protein